MTSRSRSRSRNSRRPSENAKRIQLMVYAEGEKTEPIYLTHWHRLYRDRVIVTIAPHKETTPYELVERAAAQRSSDLREEKRGRGDAFNEYWCIFDVDEHPKISDALEFAAANNVNIAMSSPCIELWFIIHFNPQTAYIERQDAQRKAKEYLGCGKVLSTAALGLLVDNYEIARNRSQGLTRKHQDDGSPAPWNPDTDVWKLVDKIRRNVA